MLNFKVTFGTDFNGVSIASRVVAPIEVKEIAKSFSYRLNVGERIDRKVPSVNANVSFYLTTDQAAEVPAFNDKLDGDLVIDVAPGFLNKFLVKEVRKSDSGMYYIKPTVNEVALFTTWKALGYPVRLGYIEPKNPVTGIGFINA